MHSRCSLCRLRLVGHRSPPKSRANNRRVETVRSTAPAPDSQGYRTPSGARRARPRDEFFKSLGTFGSESSAGTRRRSRPVAASNCPRTCGLPRDSHRSREGFERTSRPSSPHSCAPPVDIVSWVPPKMLVARCAGEVLDLDQLFPPMDMLTRVRPSTASGPSRHNLPIDGLESNDVTLLHGELLFRGEFPAALTFINGTALGGPVHVLSGSLGV